MDYYLSLNATKTRWLVTRNAPQYEEVAEFDEGTVHAQCQVSKPDGKKGFLKINNAKLEITEHDKGRKTAKITTDLQ